MKDALQIVSEDEDQAKVQNKTNLEKRARTLSESLSQNYGITPPANPSTCILCSGLQLVDYLSLNDALDDDTVTNSRKRK